MIEIIRKIVSDPIFILLASLATFYGFWLAFKQDRKEKKQARALAQKDIEKQYDVFLSHTKADIESARKLADSLQQHGVKVWFEEWVLKAGDHQPTKPRQGIQASRQIVVILTAHYFHPKSLEHYTRVVEALSDTQAYSLDKARPLIPVLFEYCEIPSIFQQFAQIDFTNTANFEWGVRQLLEV